MFDCCLLLCLYGILVYSVPVIVARKAIIGGTLARTVEDFPYMVSLIYQREGLYCGGSILTDHFVLTAAHCVAGYHVSPLYVHAGTTNLNQAGSSAVIFKVIKVFMPMSYQFTDTDNIAVLMLNRSLDMAQNRHLQPLMLPTNHHESYAGKTGVIAGYGADNWRKPTKGILRFAEADVLSEGQREYHRNSNPVKQICAKIKQYSRSANFRPRGITHEDGGGPLVYNRTVIGILSTAVSTFYDEKETSSIYTRVSHYFKFINNAIDYDPDQHREYIRTFEPSQ